MRIVNKKLIMILIPFMCISCIHDQDDDCGIYLEFIFDHNMEYADSFNPQVKTVDVFIFDNQDKLVLHKYAESTDLVGGKKMYLTDDLTVGSYKIITVGGMNEYIHIKSSDENESESIPSTLDRLILALQRDSKDVSFEFPHVWFGETVVINYDINRAVWPVHLIRNTNKFNITLQNIDSEDIPYPGIPPFTFEIVTPESGIYDYTNNPFVKEVTSYYPFSLTMADEPENTSVARLNTMRLINDDKPDTYHLAIRKADTRERIWSCDLLSLLNNTKPLHPDGTEIPMQEYLDRQGEWNIHILYRDIKDEIHNGFLAISIKVNGWIISLNDIEI